MNGLPDPYPNGTHVTVRSRTVLITDHAPNADSWHYHGIPADLAGDVITFGHEEARPVAGPAPVSAILPGVVQLLQAADIDAEVFAAELTDAQEEAREWAKSPVDQLADAVSDWVHGRLPSADLRQTAIMLGLA